MQFTLHPAAVQASVVLIRDEEYQKLLELVQELRNENDALQEEIAELRRCLGLNSTNYSKPPSSDPPAVRYPQKAPSGRKRGKQFGDKGHRRQLLIPTEVVDHRPDVCKQCGADIPGDLPVAGICERRQVRLGYMSPVAYEQHLYAGQLVS